MAKRKNRRLDLSRPRGPRRISLGIHYDPDQFGAFSEGIARLLGTARYLVIQTVLVVVWIAFNSFAFLRHWRFDHYPYILLNLAFSTQAAYAAPLILLAQNRQADRDRAQQEGDRDLNARGIADTEYLAREIAAVRVSLDDTVTQDDISELNQKLDDLLSRFEK